MESIQQSPTGQQGYNQTATYTISRTGDLVGRMYVEHDVTASGNGDDVSGVCSAYGNSLLKEVTVEIGGQQIDKHYGHWLETWAELTEPNPTGEVGSVDTSGVRRGTLYQRMSGNTRGLADGSGEIQEKMFIPLQFWFNRNPGLALPLIALQYHEVKVVITFENLAKLVNCDSTKITSNFALWADYIYLDTDERRRFAQVSHEYLIEQLQKNNATTLNGNVTANLTFNHPVKELVVVPDASGTNVAGTDVDNGPAVAARGWANDGKMQLKLNGQDRFAAREMFYFTRAQVWQHHTGYGGTQQKDSIAVYSFALKPEEHQPSGTCNFSRIDNAQLALTDNALGTDNEGITIYAVNYNVLRIMSGMGGLAYSN
tara:strand:+ start:51 stop:1163 length:1113 start_codon:yes stop_codon:yes gene_type:complete